MLELFQKWQHTLGKPSFKKLNFMKKLSLNGEEEMGHLDLKNSE